MKDGDLPTIYGVLFMWLKHCLVCMFTLVFQHCTLTSEGTRADTVLWVSFQWKKGLFVLWVCKGRKLAACLDPFSFIRNFIAESLKKFHPDLEGNLIKALPLSYAILHPKKKRNMEQFNYFIRRPLWLKQPCVLALFFTQMKFACWNPVQLAVCWLGLWQAPHILYFSSLTGKRSK